MLTFYDAFHGVGGFRYGLEQAGLKCVGGCEIDKYACQAYGVINDEECRPTDIRTVDPVRLPDFDCLVFGWPCQDNSIAGKRRGQKVGTRSGLLFEATRIMRSKKPKYFIAENVEGLLSGNDGLDFYQTIRLFTDLGYDCQWQLLNTRWFLPQNRERIFFVGHLRGSSRPEIFPITQNDFLDKTPFREKGEKVQTLPCIEATQYKGISSERFYGVLQNRSIEIEVVAKLEGNHEQNSRVYGINGLLPTLGTMQGGGQEPKILTEAGIRKITPLECFRAQGYPDWWHTKLKEAKISDSQLYKMAGNGISSPVAKEVGDRLIASF